MSQSYPPSYYGLQSSATASVPKPVGRNGSYREELERFVLEIPHGGKVLDIGCGEGRALRRIKKLRPDLQLFGIDHSDVHTLLPSGVTFTQGSVEELAQLYSAEFFDAVVCQHVIEHLVFPLSLISGIRAVLKRGGRVFIETPNWTRLFVPFSFLYFWNDYTHVHPYTAFALSRLFLEHGFSIDVLRTLSTCSWRASSSVKDSAQGAKGQHEKISAFSHAHARRGIFTRGFSYLVNPLLRDLLIVVGTKR